MGNQDPVVFDEGTARRIVAGTRGFEDLPVPGLVPTPRPRNSGASLASLRWFRLWESLGDTYAKEAEARIWQWDPAQKKNVLLYGAGDPVYYVTDTLGIFTTPKQTASGTSALCRPLASSLARNTGNRVWEILWINTYAAEEIQFLVKGAVSSIATSFTVDNVKTISPRNGEDVVASATEEVTVYRYKTGKSIDDNAFGTARWNTEDDRWYATSALDENP